MKDLIKALQIFESYNPAAATNCSHDELAICDVDPEKVSEEHIKELDDLGFFVSEEDGYFMSYRWGSC